MEQHATFDRAAVLRFADLVTSELSETREEIDALNVYPVPDGDTGTNLYLTVEAARDAVRALESAAVSEGDLFAATLAAYSRGLLLGARGNSGVILSQLVGALFRRMSLSGPDDRSAVVFAEGMEAAADAAYAAVGKPVEGTMLTVAREAAAAASNAATDPTARLGDVIGAAAIAAREALARTPEQLPVLKQAGVVDAGGRGLCVVLDAAETALTGRRAMAAAPTIGAHAIPTPIESVPTDDLTEDGPAYEVMYLLDAADEAIPELRDRLGALGDSVVVVGGDRLWKIHVHTDDVGEAVEVGIEAGVPRRIQVTHFAQQIARTRERLAEQRTGRGVVVVAAGDGLAEIFGAAGSTVLRGGPGRRPSTGEILAAIEKTGAAEVIVLPNDPDSVGVAEAAAHAAEESGQVHVVVIPTRAQVQGLAALAVHEPGRSLDADVVQMTSAARGTRHGGITIAARQAMTTAGACEPGDVLGVLQGDFAVIGDDRFVVATEVLSGLLVGGGELVTVVGGQECDDLVERCEEWVRRLHPGVDVLTYAGGQERYPLLLAVE